jgi:hypothetical protein
MPSVAMMKYRRQAAFPKVQLADAGIPFSGGSGRLVGAGDYLERINFGQDQDRQ